MMAVESASAPEEERGVHFGIQVGAFTGGRGTAVLVRDGKRVANVTYSTNRIVDGIACVLAVIAFFLPFAMIITCFGGLPLQQVTSADSSNITVIARIL